MSKLEDIARTSGMFAARREALAGALMAFEEERSALERKHFGRLRRLAIAMKTAEAQLRSEIGAAPELFVRPRTVIFHGIKIGFAKGRGRIEWEDDERVVKLIRRHCPDQIDLLIKLTEKPVKDALQQLSAEELKKLGVTVEDTGDVVVVKPVDSEIDKALRALMRELPDEIEEPES